jgi:undecaprenyl-diphosphatase
LSKITGWIGWVAQISARIEIALLAVWVAAAGALWSFLAIGSEMREGELTAFDRVVLEALRQPGQPHMAIGPHWLIESMRDITALGGVTLLSVVTVLAVIVLIGHQRKRQALVLALFVPLAQLSSGLFKNVYDRPRPSFAIFGDLPSSMSFPSGHSTVATATYFLLAVIVSSLETSRSMKALAFAVAGMLSVGIGFSRVFLGVHWPSDVIAGWCLGAAWALVAAVALRAMRKHSEAVGRG